MDLLERADALATLHRLLAETAAGGRVALLAGEAGAGKSALAGAFTTQAGPRARTLWGACDPLLTPRVLGPLHDIARTLGGALRERIATGSRAEVFDLFLEALDRPRQAARPVVVLEDLHWADEATLDMVVFLGRRLALCRALLIATYREEEVGPAHPLRTVLAGLPPGLVRRVALPPLSREAVAELARRAGRDAPPPEAHAVTGGNPLLVTEMLASPGVPPTVRHLVLSRVARLSPRAREVAGLVAVVPTGTPPELLRDRLAEVEECLAAVLCWAVIAARRATSLGAHRQAVAHYEAALPLAREDAALHEEYSLAAYHCGLSHEAIAARRTALELRTDPLHVGGNLRWFSRLSWWNGQPREAREAGSTSGRPGCISTIRPGPPACCWCTSGRGRPASTTTPGGH